LSGGDERLRVLDESRWNDFLLPIAFEDAVVVVALDAGGGGVGGSEPLDDGLTTLDGIDSRMNSGRESSVSGFFSRSERSRRSSAS
jgi:hypothetical protein